MHRFRYVPLDSVIAFVSSFCLSGYTAACLGKGGGRVLVYYVPLIRVGSSRCSVVGLHTTPLSLDLAPLCYFTTSTIPTPLPCTSPVFLPTQGIPHRSKTRITTSEHPQALNIAPFILFLYTYLSRLLSRSTCLAASRLFHALPTFGLRKPILRTWLFPGFTPPTLPNPAQEITAFASGSWFCVPGPVLTLFHSLFISSLAFPFPSPSLLLFFFSFASAQIALTPYFERSLCHYPFIALPLP